MTDDSVIDALLREEGLDWSYKELVVRGPLSRLAGEIAAVRRGRKRPIVAGVCGPQGSGKSTMSRFLAALLEARGWRTAILSLDDLYLTREERAQLAETVHPLLAVRGVPGTHDVDLGLEVLDALFGAGIGDTTRMPRFDKAADTRAPGSGADDFEGPVDIIVFEGWCVGATPQDPDLLDEPVNALEREEDPECVWRRYVNEQLAGAYQELFGRIDFLTLLQAPDFSHVRAWRTEQEHKLRASVEGTPGAARVMSDEEVARFIMHFERLTRHVLAEMPPRADARLKLDAARRIVQYVSRPTHR
jgi:D-glycerate 3-kinase